MGFSAWNTSSAPSPLICAVLTFFWLLSHTDPLQCFFHFLIYVVTQVSVASLMSLALSTGGAILELTGTDFLCHGHRLCIPLPLQNPCHINSAHTCNSTFVKGLFLFSSCDSRVLRMTSCSWMQLNDYHWLFWNFSRWLPFLWPEIAVVAM